MWPPSRDDTPIRPIQKIDSKRSMFRVFFSSEKLALLDSLPKSKKYGFLLYFCNTVLEGIKVNALAGTRKATLRVFHIHMNNCKGDNSKLTKGDLDETRIIPHTHRVWHPGTFGFSGGAKER
jgi:sugar phosphate isomerase/epimerase